MLRDEEGWEVVREQQPPTPNDRPAVWPMVIADMQQRDADGTAKYGTPLQPFNGRKPLVDAYQEALDLVVYLRQEMEERSTSEAAGNGDPIVGLLTKERDSWKSNWFDLNARFRHIKAERDEARSELETARQVIASNGQALCKLQAEKDEAWRQIDALTEERDGLREEVGQLRSSVVDTCHSHGNDRLRLIQAERERDAAREAAQKATKERDRFRNERESAMRHAEEAGEQLDMANEEHANELAALCGERDEVNKQLAKARAGLFAVTEERDRIAVKLDLTLAERDAARAERYNARAEQETATRERDEFERQLKTIMGERTRLHSEVGRLQEHVSACRLVIRGLKDEESLSRQVVQVIADPPK